MMVVGLKDLATDRPLVTLMAAVAAVPLYPRSVLRPPAARVLVRVPVEAVGEMATGTVIVQLPLAGMLLPLPASMVMAVPLAATVPPQVVLAGPPTV